MEIMLAFIEFTQFVLFCYNNFKCLHLEKENMGNNNNIFPDTMPLSMIIYNDETNKLLNNDNNIDKNNHDLLLLKYCNKISYKLFDKFVLHGGMYEINIGAKLRKELNDKMIIKKEQWLSNESDKNINENDDNIYQKAIEIATVFEPTRMELFRLLQFAFSRFMLKKEEFAKVSAIVQNS